MIVLTTGPASLARLMRRGEPARPLGPAEAAKGGGRPDQAEPSSHPFCTAQARAS